MTTRPTRLWWHLEDVLPLAEHALAAPERRITRAQALAGSATQPALIWESEPDNDWLGSNGVPIWYAQDGTPHRVPARTWRHTPTGTLGTPGQLDGASGFLRLNRRYRDPDRTPLITLLRRGARAGAHWFVLDPAALHAIDGYQVVDHRDDIAPADASWTPATVTAPEVMDRELPALIAEGYTVFDGVLPTFDRATVEQIADALTSARIGDMPGEHPIIRLHDDIAVICWEVDDAHTTREVEIDRVHPDPAGRYALGLYLWPWFTVQN
nr:hypothetical protein [Micromonospora sp. DSM 115978]